MALREAGPNGPAFFGHLVGIPRQDAARSHNELWVTKLSWGFPNFNGVCPWGLI